MGDRDLFTQASNFPSKRDGILLYLLNPVLGVFIFPIRCNKIDNTD